MRSGSYIRTRRRRYGVLAAALTGLGTAPAISQTMQTPTETAQSATPIAFDIAGGSLAIALAAFGDRAGLQILYPAEIARGLSSPGVSGTMTQAEALRRLLAGTGLGFRFTNATTVTLDRLDTAGTGSGATHLDPARA